MADIVERGPHAGDCFFNGTYPFIDVESGGSIEGVIEAQEVFLELAGPETLLVPGHGALAHRGDLEAAHDMLVTVRDRVRAALAEGRSLDDFLAAKPLADLDAAWGGGFLDAERFLRIVWADLSRRGTP